MTKRMLLMIAVVMVVLTGIGAVKYQQVQDAIAEGKSFRPPPEAVTTIVAVGQDWPATLEGIGTVTAVQGVVVSADLPGIVERIAFESGRAVRRGELLVKLDTRQEDAQLAAAEARLALARLRFERATELSGQGVTSQADLDEALAQLTQAEAAVGEIQATIDRKTIRAPFAGMLGIRQVNLGQYLPGGAPVVELQSLHPIYADFSVPQQELERLRVGAEVEVTADGGEIAVRGKLTAIDAVVDPATRNLRVRAELDNRDGRLRPGMFVEAGVLLGAGQRLVTLPASAISYAPYGNSVYVVEELESDSGEAYKGVRQQFVKLAGSRGDQVAVTSGVEAGQEIVTSGVFRLRNGGAVVVNNEVQPGNDPAPRPANS